MDPKILNLINIAYLVSFVVLVGLAIVKISSRYFKYKREKLPIPLLLKRDFIFLTGLTLPFIGLLTFRFFGLAPSSEPWYAVWVILSGGFALAGTAYWVYIEYFKVERD